MKSHLAAVISILLFLHGCTATPYQSHAYSGGYSEIQLGENTFKVSFHGNGYTSMQRATDFAMLRSAEIALLSGCRYFSVIDENSTVSSSSYSMPTTYTHTGNLSYLATGGHTYNISKPSTSNTIAIFKEKPEGVFSYNASLSYINIAQRWGITPRGFWGITPREINSDLAESYGIDRSHGVQIKELTKGGPADRSGLIEGDIILSVGGRDILNNDTSVLVQEPGSEVQVDIIRNSKRQTLSVRVGSMMDKARLMMVDSSVSDP